MDEFLKVSYTLVPLLLGLTVHGLCIRFGWLGWLARPIDAGATLGGKRLFGVNKTYRGIVAVALGTGAGFALQAALHWVGVGHTVEVVNYANPSVVGLGVAMGVAAMVSELPNSLLKRQLEIAPGAGGEGAAGVVFYVLDQIDMLVGVWIVLGCVTAVTTARVLGSVVFLFVAHQVLTVGGYRLGLRATAR